MSQRSSRLLPACRGRHAKTVRGVLIGSRAGAKTGGIDRTGDTIAGIETFRKAAEAMRLAPFARRRAGDLLEHPVEVKRADPRSVGEFGEARDGVAVPQ